MNIRTQKRNANKHTERGMTALEQSITQDGIIGAITVAADGEIFDGSARGETVNFSDAIIVESDGTRPVVHIRRDIPSADDPRAIRLGIAANRVAQLNLDWDVDILESIQAENASILDGLFDDAELAELIATIDAHPATGNGGDEFDITLNEDETRCKLGDLWQLGEHRLICGDSTQADVVARLMDGELADMVFTDPPYGVSYADKNACLNAIGKGNRIQAPILSDNLTGDALQLFLRDAFTMWPLKNGGVFYICSPAGDSETAFRLAVREAGYTLRQCLVWVKQHFVMGRSDYHYRHESILYGWRDGAAHYFIDDRTQDTVWEFDKPSANPDHPTMKPLELVAKAITNSSIKHQIVFDGFLGSGSTLIASERTERRCYGVELEPKYCDVILRRWEQETGKTAILIPNEITP